tara:strand:+ start:499 stop:1002 length:504 start_codon:yes stop_codon:yes gene_type:complete
VLDKDGFRSNVALVLGDGWGRVFWARRIGQNAWQFPQGGVDDKESAEQALYRELYEEIGLTADDVSVVQITRRWLRYKIPPNLRRNKESSVCIGQKQKWFFLKLKSNENKIRFDTTREPEFDDWRWVTFWHPLSSVVAFKKGVYRTALREFYLKNSQMQRSGQSRQI